MRVKGLIYDCGDEMNKQKRLSFGKVFFVFGMNIVGVRFMPFIFIVRRQECDFIVHASAATSYGVSVCIRRTAP